MNKELVKQLLNDDADANVPAHANLWPAIRDRVQTSKQVGQTHRQPVLWRMPLSWRPLLLSSALALVLVTLAAITWIVAPTPVSAEQVLAKAEQIAIGNTKPALQSFYGNYVSQYRNGPTQPFIQSRQETWFQAPDKYAYKYTTRSADGQESTFSNGTDGAYSYQYVPEKNELLLRDANTFMQLPGDPSTSTLQLLLFSPANLSDALERARRKTPPPLNPKSAPRPPYAYDVKLLNDREEVLNRPAYVLELTLVPGASLQLPDRQIPEKFKMWVDQEIYAVLRMEGWDAEGNVLQTGVYDSFEINKKTQTDILSVIAPPSAYILDLRLANEAEVGRAWQEAIQRASYQVFKPLRLPDELSAGRPLYDAQREIISQVFQGEVLMQARPVYDTSTGDFTVVRPNDQQPGRRVTVPKLVIIQGPRESISEGPGESRPIQVGTLTGRLYSRNGAVILIIDREGIRIKLYTPTYGAIVANNRDVYTADQLAKIAEAMQSAPKR